MSPSKARRDRCAVSHAGTAKATRTAGSNAEFRMMRRQLLLPYWWVLLVRIKTARGAKPKFYKLVTINQCLTAYKLVK